MIKSVNYHLWEPCNMRCKFCFATFQDVKNSILPKGHLPKDEALKVVKELAALGFEKITFAGGEPTLCKWLPNLIACAKKEGMTTMIVTNGSKLTNEFLKENQNYLDWIAISVDSLNYNSNIASGRAISGKKPLELDFYKSLVDRVKHFGYGLKINTVVSRNNFDEDLTDFINYAKPKRWKVLQVLPIVGQNDNNIDNFKISESEFQLFLKNHNYLQEITKIIPETNSQIKGSYAMVDPAGRFFDNTSGKYQYSKAILEVGAQKAILEMSYSKDKFIARGGEYNWKIDKLNNSNMF
jgi:radical S-adenosyl methionine domain-containing protein 2